MQTPAMFPAPSASGSHISRIDRSDGVRRALLLVLAVNVLVVIIKIIVGLRTQALSVFGAALESGLDLLNNLVGVLIVRVAARAADDDHPYGHDKFETLGALAIVGFLSMSFYALLQESIRHLILGTDAPRVAFADLVGIAATVLLSAIVFVYERRRAHALGSHFLLADAAHTASDAALALVALISLLLARRGWGAVDPILALVVALGIAWSGLSIVRETVPILVDQRAVDADEIRRLLRALPAVREVRAVRSRHVASGLLFAEVTIGVDGGTSVQAAHAIADQVEQLIAQRYGESEVTVHIEPA